MRSLTKLFGAVGSLADSILALASIVDVATGRLRQNLALDDAEAPALPHADIIDNEPTGRRSGRAAKVTS